MQKSPTATFPRATPRSPQPLFVKRPLLNPAKFINWAGQFGFSTTLAPEDLHCTIMWSKAPVLWSSIPPATTTITNRNGRREVKALGGEGAVVLKFTSTLLQARHSALKAAGCSFDYPTFQPHITITYNGNGVDLLDIDPFDGPLLLGPEKYRLPDADWNEKIVEVEI